MTEAMCTYCFNHVFSIANMGESAIKSHAKGIRHKLRCPKASMLTPKGSIVDSPSSSTCSLSSETNSPVATAVSPTTIVPANSTTNTQRLIVDSLVKDNVLLAEMRWCLHVVMEKHSFRSCEQLGDLFRAMFPNCHEAEKFTLGKTKCGYFINFGFAPHFLGLLLESVKSSPFYSLSFDESLNKALQNGQMDINVRFWNSEECKAETRYFTSEFLGRAKAEDVLESFMAATSQLDQSKLLQVGSDGPNVNLKFLELLHQKRQFLELIAVVNVGTCGLHTVHGSIKAGIKECGWELDKILKAMHFLLNDFPARQANYIQYTETDTMPRPYCGHRWCENEEACQRAALIWDDYIKYIKYCLTLPKSKQPQGKRFACLVKWMNDPLMRAKFKLVEFLTGKLNAFLRGFQTDKPMIPFLFDALKSIIESFLQMFLKKEVCNANDTIQKLLNLDLRDASIRKKVPEVGVGAKLLIMDFKKETSFSENRLNAFHRDTSVLLASIVNHMLEKSPLRRQIVRCASSLDPCLMADKDEQESSSLKFSHLVVRLARVGQISDSVANKAFEEYKVFLKDVVVKHRREFQEFDKFADRVDSFLHRFMSVGDFKNLFLVCQLISVLFHGQAHIERGFKTNKDFLKDNLKELSLVNLRMVHEHMSVHGYEPHNIPISHDLMKSMRNARARYHRYLEEQTSTKKLNSKELKRKVVSDEIVEVRRKKACYEDVIKQNAIDADRISNEAEEKQDFSLLSQSNSLRKANIEKQRLIADLARIEGELIARRDSIV